MVNTRLYNLYILAKFRTSCSWEVKIKNIYFASYGELSVFLRHRLCCNWKDVRLKYNLLLAVKVRGKKSTALKTEKSYKIKRNVRY
jgi:hypothetical protein